MKTSRLLVSFLTAAIAASVLLASSNYLPETQAGIVTTEAATAKLSQRKPMPWIPVLLLGDTDQANAILVAPKAVLLTEHGQTTQLTATTYDKDGQEVDLKLRWSSSNPQAVSVDENGLIKSMVGVGSAVITAAAPGAVSNAVSVIVATPVDGAVLVSDDQVIGAIVPEDPNAPWDLGSRITVPLSGIVPPDPGTILLGTGEKAFGGRVVSTAQNGDDVEVVVETVLTEDMFTDLVIDEEVDLSRQVPIIAKIFADNYDVSWESGGELKFVLRQKVAATATLAASTHTATTHASSAGVPMGTQVLNSSANLGPFECKANFIPPLVLDGFPTNISVNNNLWLDFHYDSDAGGLHRLLLRGDVTGTMKVTNTLTAALHGQITCEATLALIPFPVSPYLAVYVPMGIGFELDGNLTLAQAGFELKTEAKANVLAGVQCPGGAQCTMVGDLDTDAKADFRWITPDLSLNPLVVLSQFRLEPALSGFFFSHLDIGAPPPIPLRASLAKFRVGLKQASNLAIVEGQMDDASYMSNYLLSVDSALGVGDTIATVSRILQINIAQVHLKWTTPLAESPKVLEAVSDVKDFVAGDTVTFTVSLDPQHVNYPIIGYNVGKVSIYRRTEDDHGGVGPADLLAEVVPADGVVEVQMAWIADTDDTIEADYFTFVETKALPFPYFEELEVATIGLASNYVCSYKEMEQSNPIQYIKLCIDDSTGHKIETRQRTRRYNSEITLDEIFIDTSINGSPQTSTKWINDAIKNTTAPCVMQGSGWTVYGANNIEAGTFESFDILGCSYGRPCSYSSNATGGGSCWPDYSTWAGTCGAYACPPIGSIQPLEPFPGDCHQWWDHFDQDDVWVECEY